MNFYSLFLHLYRCIYFSCINYALFWQLKIHFSFCMFLTVPWQICVPFAFLPTMNFLFLNMTIFSTVFKIAKRLDFPAKKVNGLRGIVNGLHGAWFALEVVL